jgi:hypothetical protein
MRKASRRVSQMYDAALAPAGLKATQFAILSEIERRADDPPTMHELADAMVLDRSTLGQNLRPLERDRLVAWEPSDADRRRKLVILTERGRVKGMQSGVSEPAPYFARHCGQHRARRPRVTRCASLGGYSRLAEARGARCAVWRPKPPSWTRRN